MFSLLLLPSSALAWRPAPGSVSHFLDHSEESLNRLENLYNMKLGLGQRFSSHQPLPDFLCWLRIPIERQLPANRQTFGSGSGSGGCAYDPWIQVSHLLQIFVVEDIFFFSQIVFGYKYMNFRNAMSLRPGATLATTTTMHAGMETTVSRRFVLTKKITMTITT